MLGKGKCTRYANLNCNAIEAYYIFFETIDMGIYGYSYEHILLPL